MSSPNRDKTKDDEDGAEVLQETVNMWYNWTIDARFRRLSTSSKQERSTDSKEQKASPSYIKREVPSKGGSAEKKRKTLQLPTGNMPSSPRECEREIMGDDSSKNTVHIECECELPGVAGGAVPVVTSFIQSGNEEHDKEEREKHKTVHKFQSNLFPTFSNNFKDERLTSQTKLSYGTSLEKIGAVRSICFSESPILQENLKQNSFKDIPNKLESEEKNNLPLENDEVKRLRRYRKLTSDFARYVSRLAQETVNLSEISNSEAQTSAVEGLCKHVVNLKKITNELKMVKSRACSEPLIPKVSINSDPTSKQPKETNKIYIKLLPSKATIKRRKSCSFEVQTEFEGDVNRADAKEVDSVDGMFIPSFDEPPETDDEENDDEEGLDITIRFPELQKSLNQHTSHLSVCFSIISAEALGCLKRCPKEFTLKMDFVQGKMFCQSTKAPANNFIIGPDLKTIECTKSDIISIKPSTECLYISQIIPIEGAIRKNSVKFLKSADSEFFNVVSLPQVRRRNSAPTKSWISLTSTRKTSREDMLEDRACCKSMPQILSVKRILEEPEGRIIGGVAAIRPRNRGSQRKKASASWENVGCNGP